MTTFSSKTRPSFNTRSTQARRRKTSWLGLFFVLSPFITLGSVGASGALIFQSLRVNQSTVIEDIVQPSPRLSQSKDQKSAPPILSLPNIEDSAKTNISLSKDGETPVQLAPAEFYRLLTLSILEAPTPEGRLDVIESVFNRLNAPKVGLSYYGNTITNIAFAADQFEPYFHLSPEDIVDLDSAIAVLVKNRGYTPSEARATLGEVTADISNVERMTNARAHVGGRTAFKGVTQYAYRVPSEDPLRINGENFFHIEKKQTYKQLTELEKLGPMAIELAQ